MRIVKLMALLVAIMGGSFAVAGGASASRLGSGTLATLHAQAAAVTLVEKAQYYRRGYSRPRYYSYRRFYRPRYYRPRVVCRIRYGYYGPRRVCFRR